MHSTLTNQSDKVSPKPTAKSVGQLNATVPAANSQANQADVAWQLISKGISSKKADSIAETIVAGLNDQEPTRSQRNLRSNALHSSAVRDTISELINNKSTTEQHSPERRHHEFPEAAVLPEQYERLKKADFTWEYGNEAAESANAYYKHWSKSIGANETAKTLADYYEMKYNSSDEYKLLKQYAQDVETGWISPLSGFENYKNLHGRIQSEIVGKTAANGTQITGQVPHFMQRVIGTMADPEKLKNGLQVIRRSGVEIEDIEDALFHPQNIDPPAKRENGKTSVRFIGEKCVVTINPDDGLLIQTNPRKVRK